MGNRTYIYITYNASGAADVIMEKKINKPIIPGNKKAVAIRHGFIVAKIFSCGANGYRSFLFVP